MDDTIGITVFIEINIYFIQEMYITVYNYIICIQLYFVLTAHI